MEQSNKEVFRTMIERDVSNLYSQLKVTAFKLLPPSYSKIAQNIYAPKEKEIIDFLQTQTDFIVDSCFLNPNTTIEQAIVQSRTMIKEMLNAVLMEKMNMPNVASNIVIQILLG